MHAEGGGTKAYVLRSMLPAALRTRFVQTEPEPARAFAMVVLSIVNLAGGVISEGAPPAASLIADFAHILAMTCAREGACAGL